MVVMVASLAWMLAISQRRIPAVLWRNKTIVLGQNNVCLARVHDLHQHIQGATVHAESDCVCRRLPRVALHLSLFDAAAVMHRQEAAGRLVDVHDAVCADSVLVHQPAQLDEEPVRVSVLLRAVELYHALRGVPLRLASRASGS